MQLRTLTLTTIGLPIRTELRLKSLLAIVNTKTANAWTFVEGQADVVICDPTSALSQVALKRSQPLCCVSLIKDDTTTPLPNTQTLHDPVRPGDFLDLLNSVSATLAGERDTPSPAAEPAIDVADPFRFGTTLRDLTKSGSSDVFMLDTGRFVAHVVPASRSVLLRRPLDPATMRELTQPGIAVGVMQYPPSYAEQLLSAGAQRASADATLWRIGLHGPSDRMLSELPSTAAFKLRRWPDFGRLEHSPEHLRLAARLSRQESGVAELASSLGQSASNVTPFINACALCDLLKIAPTPHAVPQPARRVPVRSPRYTGLFQTIRSALGFGVSP